MKANFQSALLAQKQDAFLRQHPEAELPDNFFQEVLTDQIGRGYLNRLGDAKNWELEDAGAAEIYGWLKFERLPIKPGREDDNSLLENWQSTLSACHSMHLKLAFVLIRKRGRVELYLGATSDDGDSAAAVEKLRQAIMIHMPGAQLDKLSQSNDEPDQTLGDFKHFGIVTGIPSLRGEKSGVSLQTLDKLARGIQIADDDG